MGFDFATLSGTSGTFSHQPTKGERSGNLTAWPHGDDPRAEWTWEELVAYVQNPECTESFKSGRASHRSGKGEDFHALPDWNANTRAVAEGWREGLQHVEAPLASAVSHTRAMPLARERLDVGGERPSIPHAVAGDPRSMWRRAPMAKRIRPVVRILMNVGAPWYIKPHVLINRGAAILAWCNALEASGYSTEITTVWRTSTDNKSMEVRTAIKGAGEKFDIDRLAYAMVCPDFMRRGMFAALEACHNLGSFRFGYGISQNVIPEAGIAYFPTVQTAEHYETTEVAVESVRTVLLGVYENLPL